MKREYNFKEIFKLRDMLDKANIDYVFKDETYTSEYTGTTYTGYHIWCFDKGISKESDSWYISVIQSYSSYGREEDLLEIMGLLTKKELKNDSVVGYLTAEDVFNRITKHLKKVKQWKKKLKNF